MSNDIEIRMRPRDVSRFWSKVAHPLHRDPADCWEWRGTIGTSGYGRFKLNGRSEVAHRIAYLLEHGQVPLGLELDHLCRNRVCINPAHLEPVTHQENVQRGLAGDLSEGPQRCISLGHQIDDGHATCLECRREYGRNWLRQNAVKKAS